jgi:TPR repeat protein
MYLSGRGVPQDFVTAAMWFRRAADQGEDTAQFLLGMLYQMGNGVPQDHMQANKCFNLSASRTRLTGKDRDGLFKVRDDLAAKMTPEQVAEAQRLACEWKPKAEHYSIHEGRRCRH